MPNIPVSDDQAPLLNQLKSAAEQLQRAKSARTNLIREARAAGITWDEIGNAAGITRSACIQLMQRTDGGRE